MNRGFSTSETTPVNRSRTPPYRANAAFPSAAKCSSTCAIGTMLPSAARVATAGAGPARSTDRATVPGNHEPARTPPPTPFIAGGPETPKAPSRPPFSPATSASNARTLTSSSSTRRALASSSASRSRATITSSATTTPAHANPAKVNVVFHPRIAPA